jgi:hypothetical protein
MTRQDGQERKRKPERLTTGECCGLEEIPFWLMIYDFEFKTLPLGLTLKGFRKKNFFSISYSSFVDLKLCKSFKTWKDWIITRFWNRSFYDVRLFLGKQQQKECLDVINDSCSVLWHLFLRSLACRNAHLDANH